MRAVSGGIRGEYPLSTTEVGEEGGDWEIRRWDIKRERCRHCHRSEADVILSDNPR